MTELPSPQDAMTSFVYGYPLVYDLDEVAGFVQGGGDLPISAPWNTFAYARDLLGPETKFVSPNNDTLYVMAMCDVRDNPVSLEVPATGSRYYVLQFVDAWTNNFAYVGRRATGTAAGRYLLTAADHAGPVPEGTTVIKAPTGVFSIVGRVQVDGPDDLAAVRALQDEFRLASHDPTIVPAGVPVADSAVDEDLRWWETFRVQLAAFPPPAGDAEFLAVCSSLGLTDERTPYADPSPELRALLVEAERSGRETIDALMTGGADLVNGWREAAHLFDYNLDFFEVGTIDAPEWKIADRTTAYATRAVAARAGLWGNHGYEADYFITAMDADGDQLSGAHTYELRLETPPPVDAFWSLTMYDTPDFYLVDNPIDRYSIGDRTPGLVTADDGSITILLQAESPGADLEANWLPAPAGDFRPIMRLYEPGAPVLAGQYELPHIRRTS